jgi:geranylgeranyl transferase type-1 subunit beta
MGNLAMTYTALAILKILGNKNFNQKILGDDYSKVKKDYIIKGIKSLQTKSGCFTSTKGGKEEDLRFLYCACVISHFLDDFSGIDINDAVKHINNCQTYDGSFAHDNGLEGLYFLKN